MVDFITFYRFFFLHIVIRYSKNFHRIAYIWIQFFFHIHTTNTKKWINKSIPLDEFVRNYTSIKHRLSDRNGKCFETCFSLIRLGTFLVVTFWQFSCWIIISNENHGGIILWNFIHNQVLSKLSSIWTVVKSVCASSLIF